MGRGSGLSLERFIKGKAHKSKADAKSKKKVIIRKAQRRREYEQIKKREGKTQNDTDDDDKNGPTSFYDKFFSELKKENDQAKIKTDQGESERRRTAKPDPFFKAKKKAAVVKDEKKRAFAEKEKHKAEMEKKINQRKKRHVKLSVRTASGQPVIRNHIGDILAKLQTEKNAK